MFHRLFLAAILLILTSTLRADDAALADEPQTQRERTTERLEELQLYSISSKADGEVVGSTGSFRARLIEDPVLNWSNPIRQTDQGAMFLWTAEDGRPLLGCCCYVVDSSVVHEMISLAERPLLVESMIGEGKTFEPPESFQPIPDSPFPSTSRPLRLAQMRKQAGRFDVKIVGQNLVYETRLLRQPVYRYPAGMDVDGAVFAFVQGTDPECLLVVESREGEFVSRTARVTNWRLRVLRDDMVVKDFDGGGDVSYGKFWRRKN
jgi:hypothetical protein